LRSVQGGVLARAGHTEAAVDLVQLAGCGDVAIIAEVVHDEGPMMRYDEAKLFAAKNNLELITIAEIREYREASPSA
jgi:3,4-dihydroxy 2-butanone 4-phosphate synthase/GTP cyclohydrolase II